MLKIDTAFLLSKDWTQFNSTQSDLNQFVADSTKFMLVKDGTWGNSIIKDDQTWILGEWKFKEEKIIIYDSKTHGFGYEYEISELKENLLVIKFQDLNGKMQIIKLE
ncbi:MAG: hypothetical protein ACI9J3_001391 [Parvicellaceae bacterium]|jgi:hypothetical protein